MNGINDELILAARLLLTALFLIFGWRKLRDYSGTVSQIAQLGVLRCRHWLLPWRSSWSFRLRSRSRLARSRVLRLCCWFYTHWELR